LAPPAGGAVPLFISGPRRSRDKQWIRYILLQALPVSSDEALEWFLIRLPCAFE
jgi:hypothetical protein